MADSRATIPLRERHKAQTRELILDAMIDALSSGDPQRATHEGLAAAAGVSRMTVYRYFPDREALMQAVWGRVTARAGPRVTFPETEHDLTTNLKNVYEGFDRIAPIATMIRSTPQGRAVRLSQKERRQRMYTAAAANLVKDLSDRDRKLATAVLQFLHTTAWLEMRDHWDFTGAETAEACGWAMRTLVNDLRTRGSKPLDES